MKKLLDGKIYDIDAATKIAEHRTEDSRPYKNKYLIEELYMTKNRNFFIITKKCEETTTSIYEGDEKFIALNNKEALQFIEKRDLNLNILDDIGFVIEEA